MRVMLSELILSFPLTIPRLQRNRRVKPQAHYTLTYGQADREDLPYPADKGTKVNVETAIVGSIYPQICSQLSELILNIIVYEVSQGSRARHSISVVEVTGRCT